MAKKTIPVRQRTKPKSITAKRAAKNSGGRSRPNLTQTLQRVMSSPEGVPHGEMLELQSAVGSDVMRKVTVDGADNGDGQGVKRPTSTPFGPIQTKRDSKPETTSHTGHVNKDQTKQAKKIQSTHTVQRKANRNNLFIQRRAKGGLEYTELKSKTELHRLKNVKNQRSEPTIINDEPKAMADFYYDQFPEFGEKGLAVFVVPLMDRVANQVHGGNTNGDGTAIEDGTAFTNGSVKLENDVVSAEWIIEGHENNGITYNEMVAGINKIFTLRRQLYNIISSIPTKSGDEVIFTSLDNVTGDLNKGLASKKKQKAPIKLETGTKTTSNDIPLDFFDDLNTTTTEAPETDNLSDDFFDDMISPEIGFTFGSSAPEIEAPVDTQPPAPVQIKSRYSLFKFDKLSAKSEGSAQITMLYRNQTTLRRITELNSSLFIGGHNVKKGVDKDERSYLTGGGSVKTGKFSSTKSGGYDFRRLLEKDSNPLVWEGIEYLTAKDMAVLKQMVVNDAVAATVGRFKSSAGEAHQKNLLPFLPKAKRNTYVYALAGRKVPHGAMSKIWTILSKSINTLSNVLVPNLNPQGLASMDLKEVVKELDIDENVTQDTKGKDVNLTRDNFLGLGAKISGGIGTQNEVTEFLGVLFGDNNILLRSKMLKVINAYTETDKTGEQHEFEGDNGDIYSEVVRSFAFAKPGNDFGGVFETRNEVRMAEDDLDGIKSAVKKLMSIAGKNR